MTAVALAVALRSGTPEPVIRFTGLVLQLLGIATVILGIETTRRLFGHPSFFAKSGAWLQRFPLLRKSTVVGVVASSLASAILEAHGEVVRGAPKGATIKARLEVAEKNIGELRNRMSDTETRVRQDLLRLRESLQAEEAARVRATADLAKRIEGTATGGFAISAMGALWLVFGVVLSSLSPEIARWLDPQ